MTRRMSGAIRMGAILRRLPHPLRKRLASMLVVPVASGGAKGLRMSVLALVPGYASGNNEMIIQETLAQHLAPGSVFYDIGANVGFLTLVAARMVGFEGRVVAFEPVPSNADALRINVRINRFTNVTVVEKAVSDMSAQIPLWTTRHPGGATLCGVCSKPVDTDGVITVDTITIDRYIEHAGPPPPDMVKIDVEGAELNVLRGMRHTLLAHTPIVLCEVDDDTKEALAPRQDEIDRYLRTLGYRTSHIENAYRGGATSVGHTLAVARSPAGTGGGRDKGRFS